jgi:hypothetical protein
VIQIENFTHNHAANSRVNFSIITLVVGRDAPLAGRLRTNHGSDGTPTEALSTIARGPQCTVAH